MKSLLKWHRNHCIINAVLIENESVVQWEDKLFFGWQIFWKQSCNIPKFCFYIWSQNIVQSSVTVIFFIGRKSGITEPSSNSSLVFAFTFTQMPLGKACNHLLYFTSYGLNSRVELSLGLKELFWIQNNVESNVNPFHYLS